MIDQADYDRIFTDRHLKYDEKCVLKKSSGFHCDDQGNKVCDGRQLCKHGYWDENACMCFSMIKCAMMCSPGKDLDPRLGCKCVDQSVIDALYQCVIDDREDDFIFAQTDKSAGDGPYMLGCDRGRKVCAKGVKCASRGDGYDDRACMCFPRMKCRKACPRG